MKKFNKKFIAPIVAVSVALIMILVYFIGFAPKRVKGTKNVEVIFEYAENSLDYKVKSDAETVAELLEEIDKTYGINLVTEDSAYGKYITSINGIEQDTENGYYYIYEIKGLDFANGISTQTIKDGDVITFKYGYAEYDESYNMVSLTLKGKGSIAVTKKSFIIFICIISVLVVSAIAYMAVYAIKRKKNVNEQ